MSVRAASESSSMNPCLLSFNQHLQSSNYPCSTVQDTTKIPWVNHGKSIPSNFFAMAITNSIWQLLCLAAFAAAVGIKVWGNMGKPCNKKHSFPQTSLFKGLPCFRNKIWSNHRRWESTGPLVPLLSTELMAEAGGNNTQVCMCWWWQVMLVPLCSLFYSVLQNEAGSPNFLFFIAEDSRVFSFLFQVNVVLLGS